MIAANGDLISVTDSGRGQLNLPLQSYLSPHQLDKRPCCESVGQAHVGAEERWPVSRAAGTWMPLPTATGQRGSAETPAMSCTALVGLRVAVAVVVTQLHLGEASAWWAVQPCPESHCMHTFGR